MSNKQRTQFIAGVGLLTAIVILLQYIGRFLKPGTFSISLVLIPIIIGGALYGIGAGAWLGLVFGIVVLVTGDAATFLAINVPGTVATVLVKGTAAGALAALVYKLVSPKNEYLAVVLASIVCPVVNTGIFLIGCLLFFMDTISAWAAGAGFEQVGLYMIVGLCGWNFLIELGIDLVLCPIIFRIIRIGRHMHN